MTLLLQVGAKRALKVSKIWPIRFFRDREGRMRDRAFFDLAIDCKLRGWDLVKITIGTLVAGTCHPHAIDGGPAELWKARSV